MMSEALSTNDINTMLRHITMFAGTFPSDIVPIQQRKYPQAFVINTAPNRTSGEHWTALILTDSKCLYFDSLGCQIQNVSLLKSLKKVGVRYYKYNSCQIQSVLSSSCGYYCIAFVMSFVSNSSYSNFMSKFVTDLKQNDDICYKFIKTILNKQY